jgi:hypothetical protein
MRYSKIVAIKHGIAGNGACGFKNNAKSLSGAAVSGII